MKSTIHYILLGLVLLASSCEMEPQQMTDNLPSLRVSVMNDGAPFPENATVTLTSQNYNISYTGISRGGFVIMNVPAGLYEITVDYRTKIEGESYIYNGSTTARVSADTDNTCVVDLVFAKTGNIIIKELYIGGCQRDDGSGAYQYDKYVVIYNNGRTPYDASNLCFAFLAPENSNSDSRYLIGGELSYIAEGWLPAMYSVWWFGTEVVIQPYSQIVVAINGAVNHTLTYSKSVDLSRPEYYAMYDPESGYINASSYPAPSADIPSTHYLSTYKASGGANAWPISISSPAFFIFEMQDIDSYVRNSDNMDSSTYSYTTITRIPIDCVQDALEVFRADQTTNRKRFPSTLDAGYVTHTNQQGYSLYRNVDKDATESLPENSGLLVYNYAGGTTGISAAGSTDPSGIDAEASIAQGAHIVYQDTNNSSNDFHLRATASLKSE